VLVGRGIGGIGPEEKGFFIEVPKRKGEGSNGRNHSEPCGKAQNKTGRHKKINRLPKAKKQNNLKRDSTIGTQRERAKGGEKIFAKFRETERRESDRRGAKPHISGFEKSRGTPLPLLGEGDNRYDEKRVEAGSTRPLDEYDDLDRRPVYGKKVFKCANFRVVAFQGMLNLAQSS